MNRTRISGVVALLGAVVVWSASLSVVHIAVDSASPGTITFWRCVLGAAALTVWAARGGRLTHALREGTRSSWLWAVAAGATCGIAFLLIAVAMRDVGSGPAGVVLSMIPGLTVLLAALDGSSTGFGIRHAFALALGMLGAATLALPAGGGWGMTGIIALAFAALAHAATNITSGHSLDRLNPVVVAAVSMATGALVAAPFASFDLSSIPARGIAALIVLGLLPTGAAYVMYYYGIRLLGSTVAAYSNFLVPPVAVLAGVVALGEVPGAPTLIALVLATAALYIGLKTPTRIPNSEHGGAA